MKKDLKDLKSMVFQDNKTIGPRTGIITYGKGQVLCIHAILRSVCSNLLIREYQFYPGF